MEPKIIFQHSLKKTMMFGMIGGFIAGSIMMLVPFYTISSEISFELLPRALGTMIIGNNPDVVSIGIAAHLITSTLIGLIFGTIVSKVTVFRITSYHKGITEGIIAGIIAFVVISIPLTVFAISPILPNLIAQDDPNITNEMAITSLQQNMEINTIMSILRHVVYGTFLGIIASSFIIRMNPSGYSLYRFK